MGLKHLPIFQRKTKKLDSKAIRCTFIGYCSQYKAYRLFNPSNHKIFISRDVKFHEHDNEENNEHYDGWDIPYFEEEDAENNQDQQQTKAEGEQQQQQ